MERIDDLMERLKGQIPQVPGADDLTDSIMAAIEGLDSGSKHEESRHVPMWITMLRTVSSVAAVILVALFIHVDGVEEDLISREPVNASAKVIMPDVCEECTPADIFNIKKERIQKRKEREILKNKLYASYKF